MQHNLTTRQTRFAFTLVELLVVMAILAVLVALSLPAIQHVRERGRQATCQNNLRQIGLALHHFHSSHGRLPPGVGVRNDSYPFLSWGGRLMPQLDQGALWGETVAAFSTSVPFLRSPPHAGFTTPMPVFTCPSDGRQLSHHGISLTCYLGVEGVNQTTRDGVLFLDSTVRFADVRDGTSNTLMVGERPASADEGYGGWGQARDGSADSVLGAREVNTGSFARGCPAGPYDYRAGSPDDQCDAFHFWSHHPGGANFILADGSVRFLGYRANDLLPALCTRAGGEAQAVP